MTHKTTEKTNPYFTVKRERLHQKDRMDTGYDALYRADDGTQLSVGSIERLQSSQTPGSSRLRIPYARRCRGGTETDQNGPVRKPGESYSTKCSYRSTDSTPPDGGVKSTAVDGTPPKEEYVPRLIIRNSYDKTSSFSITYAGFRFVCKNGVMIGERVHEIRVLHRGAEINITNMEFSTAVMQERSGGVLRTI